MLIMLHVKPFNPQAVKLEQKSNNFLSLTWRTIISKFNIQIIDTDKLLTTMRKGKLVFPIFRFLIMCVCCSNKVVGFLWANTFPRPMVLIYFRCHYKMQSLSLSPIYTGRDLQEISTQLKEA